MTKLKSVKNRVQGFLNGRKTYIVSALMVLVGLVNFLAGDVTFVEFVSTEDARVLLEGLGLGFLRAGISKVE